MELINWIYIAIGALIFLFFLILSVRWNLRGLVNFKLGRRSRKQEERSRKLNELERLTSDEAGVSSGFRIGDTAFNNVGFKNMHRVSVDNTFDNDVVVDVGKYDDVEQTEFVEIREKIELLSSDDMTSILLDDVVSENENQNDSVKNLPSYTAHESLFVSENETEITEIEIVEDSDDMTVFTSEVALGADGELFNQALEDFMETVNEGAEENTEVGITGNGLVEPIVTENTFRVDWNDDSQLATVNVLFSNKESDNNEESN